jgi:YfiH family protein
MAAEFLNAPALTAAGLVHAFSLRDASAAQLAAHLGVGGGGLREAKQVHGAAVVIAGRAPVPEGTEADALVTAEPGVAVAIKVADCVPLVAFADTGAVAAIHAGWRGFVAGVIPGALAELGRVGRSDRVESWKVVIGPHIGACCFEVGADVADTIAAASDHRDGIVVPQASGKNPHVDLDLAVRVHLARAGIAAGNVVRLEGCTRCDAERFHSYRRDGANAGRHRIAAVASAR